MCRYKKKKTVFIFVDFEIFFQSELYNLDTLEIQKFIVKVTLNRVTLFSFFFIKIFFVKEIFIWTRSTCLIIIVLKNFSKEYPSLFEVTR